MEYVKLGSTGLDVSRLSLGTMGFGDRERWIHQWVLDEEESRPVIKHALDSGINFFDTANVYSLGRSEEIVGKALADYAKRDEIVLATKVHGRMHEGPNGGGLSRKAILAEVEASLRRLGTDYIDLYLIHRWDYTVPIEETMRALDDVVRSGKVRYIGASAMFAWQFLQAQHVAEVNGWTKFISMQNHYNLLYREEEREMMPLLRELGVASTPYSPLAAGRLTRDWDADTERARTDTTAKSKYDSTEETPADRRAGRPDRRGPRCGAGAGGAGLAAREGSGGLPDHRRHEDRAPRRRARRARTRAHDRRDRRARGAVRPPPGLGRAGAERERPGRGLELPPLTRSARGRAPHGSAVPSPGGARCRDVTAPPTALRRDGTAPRRHCTSAVRRRPQTDPKGCAQLNCVQLFPHGDDG